MILGIDPGHGGPGHRGTSIPDGPDEADWCLSMSRRVDSRIRDLGSPGLRSVQLRLYDQAIGLTARAQLAQANDCTLALPIHVDHGSLRGMHCYVWPGDALGLVAAKAIMAARPRELVGTAQSIVVIEMVESETNPDDYLRRPRSVMQPYNELGISVCLVECGFSRADREHLLRISTQDQIAAAIAAGGLAVYKEIAND